MTQKHTCVLWRYITSQICLYLFDIISSIDIFPYKFKQITCMSITFSLGGGTDRECAVYMYICVSKVYLSRFVFGPSVHVLCVLDHPAAASHSQHVCMDACLVLQYSCFQCMRVTLLSLDDRPGRGLSRARSVQLVHTWLSLTWMSPSRRLRRVLFLYT